MGVASDVKPVVYVLWFDRPLHHAQRYLGATKNFDRRLKHHCKGRGAFITRAAREQGIHLSIEAYLELPTYEEAVALEQRLKRWKNNKKAAAYLNRLYAKSASLCHAH